MDLATRMLVAIESPFMGASTAERRVNIEYAREATRHSIDVGEAPFTMHLLYPQPGILDDRNSSERFIGMQSGFAWARLAELRAFYIDRGFSEGMCAGMEQAVLYKQDVMFRSLRGLTAAEVVGRGSGVAGYRFGVPVDIRYTWLQIKSLISRSQGRQVS